MIYPFLKFRNVKVSKSRNQFQNPKSSRFRRPSNRFESLDIWILRSFEISDFDDLKFVDLSSYPLGWFRCHSQAVSTMVSRSGYRGFQPNSFLIFSELATSRAGSPGLRADSMAGIAFPVTFLIVSITSLHGISVSVAEIVNSGPASCLQFLKGQDMGLGKVGDMNIIADAGSIRRFVIRTEDRDRLSSSKQPGGQWE